MVLFDSINKLANSRSAAGLPAGRRRRFIIPPSTNLPLFSYGEGDDQRSFLSLGTGSVADNGDSASVSTSRSLPSTLSSVHTTETQESFTNWLVEEHQRRKTSDSQSPGSIDIERPDDWISHRSSSVMDSLTSDDFSIDTTLSMEVKKLARFSIPLILTFLLEQLFSLVGLLVVGHLGKKELAAVSLGSMTTTITFAIFEGIATALDTLTPQAYGAGNYELVSMLVQKCTVFSWVIFIPCGVIWWFSPLFLWYFIDDDEVVELTALFLRVMIIGAPGYIFFENSKRFLQAQGIFEASTGVLVISAPIHILLSWILVWSEPFGLGYVGSPIATVINFWLMNVLLIMYVAFIDGSKCWYGIESLSTLFTQWGSVTHLAIPGIVMLESEYLAYEIMTLIASSFGTVELAAQSAVSSAASFTYMVPFAVSVAASTRIANFIGAQNLEAAKLATKSSMLVAGLVSLFNCSMLFIFKNIIAILFTRDEEVKSVIVGLLDPLVCLIQICDGIASVASGILRAQGSQKIGGIINLLGYYAFAMPLAIGLVKFTDLTLSALWIGIGSGMILIGLAESFVIFRSDWDDIAMKAGLLLYVESEQSESLSD